MTCFGGRTFKNNDGLNATSPTNHNLPTQKVKPKPKKPKVQCHSSVYLHARTFSSEIELSQYLSAPLCGNLHSNPSLNLSGYLRTLTRSKLQSLLVLTPDLLGCLGFKVWVDMTYEQGYERLAREDNYCYCSSRRATRLRA